MHATYRLALDEPSLWFVVAPGGRCLSVSKSLRAALEESYELAASADVMSSPSSLAKAGGGVKLDSGQIRALWQELDFPLPV